METKSNFWYLNIAILISIVLHAYAIFFIKEFNIDFLDKKKKNYCNFICNWYL